MALKNYNKGEAGTFIMTQPHLSDLLLYFKACETYIIEKFSLMNLEHSF